MFYVQSYKDWCSPSHRRVDSLPVTTCRPKLELTKTGLMGYLPVVTVSLTVLVRVQAQCQCTAART